MVASIGELSMLGIEWSSVKFWLRSILCNWVASPAEYALSKKANEVATAAVVQAQADVDKAKEELTYTDLKSALNGVVTDIYAEIGETVAPGQIVCTIANLDLREAVVDIAEDETPNLRSRP